ncbi:MAG: hypothetical protein M1820_009977 [Bogoriella megaspora]|nr:MAG: hypothetical protein M1820_009977 [Bogoriella megaspora]
MDRNIADTTKKPRPQAGTARQPATNSTNLPAAGSTRSPSRNSNTSGVGAASTPARVRSIRGASGSPVSAKAAVRKAGIPSGLSSTTQVSDSEADEDARAELLSLVDDLKERLKKAEEASEEYRKQVEVIQSRLDESHKEQAKLEEKAHEDDERVEGLTNDRSKLIKQKRELEGIYEAERASWMKEKDEASAREDELQHSLQRVKENMMAREIRNLDAGDRPGLSRTSSLRSEDKSPNLESSGAFAPPLQRSNSSSANSKLVLQKDKIIESLRLELAEAQIKLVEMENMGGGKLREVEKALMETRMANARLMEDNESFQLLLSEKTLNGDFRDGLMSGKITEHERPGSREGTTAGGGSLADELSSVNTESDSAEGENSKRLQAEIHSLRDQNKALTLYINSIIERLLNHKGLESVLDKTPDLLAGPNAASAKHASSITDKDLPPVPPEKDPNTAGTSFLQRARSVIAPRSSREPPNHDGPRPRPASVIQTQSSPAQPSVNEDPDTAPSIPLGRSQSVRAASESAKHRRRTSDWSHAAVVQNMYRGLPPGPTSPTGLASPRASFFGSRVPSGNSVPTIEEHDTDQEADASAVRNEALAALEGDVPPPAAANIPTNPAYAPAVPSNLGMSSSRPASEAGSPPRSVASSAGENSRAAGPAVMGGNRMRPLRLVQDKQEQDEREKKAANRGSWMGWFNKGKGEDG